MTISKIKYALLGLVAGLIAGFFITNEVNRREAEGLRAALVQAQSTANNASSPKRNEEPPRLSSEELQAAIGRADANPKDVYQQRNLGQALYLYAANTGDAATLRDAVRLLRRAHELDPKNYDTLVLLGNALFDSGKLGDANSFTEARTFYQEALRQRPDDINVRTDLGLAYFFAKPSDPNRAAIEYRKSLAVNPRHPATLQNLAAALISLNQLEEAERALASLKEIDAANPSLANLQTQLAQARHARQGIN
ncbi:MAG: tetratricopeptide repeat protein [Pyrinomonadaceae bacterium MAG19_C2-C3]|nr:tetratricopeptide repeat protein [Pyrinomonadaceae bacterium MAG19_C2-C3]